MVRGERLKFKKFKSQGSYELLLVIGVVLVLLFSIMDGFFSQASPAVVLTALKDGALRINFEKQVMFKRKCDTPVVNSSENGFVVAGSCLNSSDAITLANLVEEEQCGVSPDNDNVIDCFGNPVVEVSS